MPSRPLQVGEIPSLTARKREPAHAQDQKLTMPFIPSETAFQIVINHVPEIPMKSKPPVFRPYALLVSALISGGLVFGQGGDDRKKAVAATELTMESYADVFVGDHVKSSGDLKEGYHSFRIPALLRAANGDLLAFAEARRDGPEDNGKIDLVLKRSRDGGKSWGALQFIYGESEGRMTYGNPVPILDHHGTIHLISCWNNAYGILYQRSTDNGLTWSSPWALWDSKGAPNTGGSAKIPLFKSVLGKKFGIPVERFGTGPGHGICLPGGRLVVPLWLHGKDTQPYQGPKLDAADLEREGLLAVEGESRFFNGVLLSDDGGATWRPGGLGPLGSNESAIARRSDGSLMLNARFVSGTYRTEAISTDGGESFADPRLRIDLMDVACQGSLLDFRLPDGRHAMAFANPAVKGIGFSRRADLTLRISLDDGLSWPHALLMDDGPSGYSDLCDLGDGRIGVLYERGDHEYRERIAFRSVSVGDP